MEWLALDRSEKHVSPVLLYHVRGVTHDLAIEVVLLHHDDVDGLWVLECQKAETS